MDVSGDARPDRLSGLVRRFRLSVRPAPEADGHLHIIAGDDGVPVCLMLCRAPGAPGLPAGRALVLSARVDWGGGANPLIAGLPDALVQPVDAEDIGLVGLFLAEASAMRCGAEPVLDRLGEVLVIRLLRASIAARRTETGLLSALSDLRLARALVAIHDDPGASWTAESLADRAGLSVSRFNEVFSTLTGEAPMAYLRRWRIGLADRDLKQGDRVQTVARRYGYGSPEALTRAYRRQFGLSPRAARQSPSGVAAASG